MARAKIKKLCSLLVRTKTYLRTGNNGTSINWFLKLTTFDRNVSAFWVSYLLFDRWSKTRKKTCSLWFYSTWINILLFLLYNFKLLLRSIITQVKTISSKIAVMVISLYYCIAYYYWVGLNYQLRDALQYTLRI